MGAHWREIGGIVCSGSNTQKCQKTAIFLVEELKQCSRRLNVGYFAMLSTYLFSGKKSGEARRTRTTSYLNIDTFKYIFDYKDISSKTILSFGKYSTEHKESRGHDTQCCP